MRVHLLLCVCVCLRARRSSGCTQTIDTFARCYLPPPLLLLLLLRTISTLIANDAYQ